MKFKKKGVAGLDIFLSVIAMIFIIGIIVMAFALTSSKIMETDSAFDRSSSASVTNETNYMNGSIGYFNVDKSSLKSPVCVIGEIYNGTDLLSVGNYTSSSCKVTLVSNDYVNETWKVSYTYTYLVPNEVSDVLNDTTIAISSATDWFAIFITIAAVVVLILLIVLIIVSLRQAGLMGGESGGA